MNEYNRKKTGGQWLMGFALLTANAWQLSFFVQFKDHLDYTDSLIGITATLIFLICVPSFCLFIAAMVQDFNKKEHHKGLWSVNRAMIIMMLQLFTLNIAVAALGHVSMMGLKEKLEGSA